jgi:hypothetical protein
LNASAIAIQHDEACHCRYQDQGERLQIENIKLTDELENQKINLRDINEFLTNELKARSLTTAALEEKVQELTQLAEDNKKSHEVRTPCFFSALREAAGG